MKLITIQEAAKILSVDRKTVYHLIEKSNLPAYRLSERGIRIDEEALLTWIEKRKI